jgi:hypothetical protein
MFANFVWVANERRLHLVVAQLAAADDHVAVSAMHALDDVYLIKTAKLECIAALVCSNDEELVREALLHAIAARSDMTVELVCEYIQRQGWVEVSGLCTRQHCWRQDEACLRSTAFQPHITPLMLACFINHYPIVHLLLARAHVIRMLHRYLCKYPRTFTVQASRRVRRMQRTSNARPTRGRAIIAPTRLLPSRHGQCASVAEQSRPNTGRVRTCQRSA